MFEKVFWHTNCLNGSVAPASEVSSERYIGKLSSDMLNAGVFEEFGKSLNDIAFAE